MPGSAHRRGYRAKIGGVAGSMLTLDWMRDRKRSAAPPCLDQVTAGLIQWVWSLSTDEHQVTAALFSGLVRVQSVTSRW